MPINHPCKTRQNILSKHHTPTGSAAGFKANKICTFGSQEMKSQELLEGVTNPFNQKTSSPKNDNDSVLSD